VGVGSWIAAGSLGDDGANGVAITAYFLLGALHPAAESSPYHMQKAASSRSSRLREGLAPRIDRARSVYRRDMGGHV